MLRNCGVLDAAEDALRVTSWWRQFQANSLAGIALEVPVDLGVLASYRVPELLWVICIS